MHTTAEPSRYSVTTANRLANTLYFHLMLGPKSIQESHQITGNVRPRFVPHGE